MQNFIENQAGVRQVSNSRARSSQLGHSGQNSERCRKTRTSRRRLFPLSMDVEKGPTILSNRRQQSSFTQYFLGRVLPRSTVDKIPDNRTSFSKSIHSYLIFCTLCGRKMAIWLTTNGDMRKFSKKKFNFFRSRICPMEKPIGFVCSAQATKKCLSSTYVPRERMRALLRGSNFDLHIET